QLSTKAAQSSNDPNGARISRIAAPWTKAKPSVSSAALSEAVFVNTPASIFRFYCELCQPRRRLASSCPSFSSTPQRLQQERLDAMRMHDVVARRPCEDRKSAILGGDERHRVTLIVDELCGRKMSRATEARRVDDLRDPALNRLSDGDLLDLRRSRPPNDLGAERNEMI